MGTAGLDRFWVSGKSLVPRPPPRTTATTSSTDHLRSQRGSAGRHRKGRRPEFMGSTLKLVIDGHDDYVVDLASHHGAEGASPCSARQCHSFALLVVVCPGLLCYRWPPSLATACRPMLWMKEPSQPRGPRCPPSE